MSEYTCLKCKSECEVVFEDLKGNGIPMAVIWCDECNDYAEGSDKIIEDLTRDHLGDLTDAAHERMKDG